MSLPWGEEENMESGKYESERVGRKREGSNQNDMRSEETAFPELI